MAIKSVLCFGAHPDDELSIAGLLIHMARQGVAVHLLYLTGGESGPRGVPPIAPNADLGKIRPAEAICASGIIGAETVEFLGYVDISQDANDRLGPLHDPDVLAGQIRAHIERTQPQVVFTHGSDGDYGHPAHKLCHRMVKRVVQEMGAQAPLFYGWDAWYADYPWPERLNQSDSTHAYIDVEQYLDLVRAMGQCHRTQSSTWHYRKEQKNGRKMTFEEIWRNQPTLFIHRHLPPVAEDANPQDELMAWLQNQPGLLKTEMP
jgi:N-acetylglucosamine malate deacetylase 2